MTDDFFLALGWLLYPLASASLCLWLAQSGRELYLSWSRGELSSGGFYSLLLRAGVSSLTGLSLLMYLAGKWSTRALALPATAFLACFLLPELAQAQNLPNIVLPEEAGKGDILSTFNAIVVYAGRFFTLMVSFTGICGICWQIIAAFFNARERGDWGHFGIVFVLGAVVLLFIVAMGQFAWSYLESVRQL